MIINFRGTQIHYNVEGKGDALVLLHGFLESSTMWNSLMPVLSKRFKVIAVDLPGHGKSGVFGDIHSMQLMADCILEILRIEDVKDAHFVGHSMGGYVALAYLKDNLEQVTSITLLNSTPSEDSISRKKNRERAVQLIKKYPQAFISMGVTNLFANEKASIYEETIKAMKAEANTYPIDGIIANIKGMKTREDTRELLRNYKGQKNIITGKEDPIVLFNEIKNIAKVTDSKLYSLSGGHMSHIEAKNEVLDIILRLEAHSSHVQ